MIRNATTFESGQFSVVGHEIILSHTYTHVNAHHTRLVYVFSKKMVDWVNSANQSEEVVQGDNEERFDWTSCQLV